MAAKFGQAMNYTTLAPDQVWLCNLRTNKHSAYRTPTALLQHLTRTHREHLPTKQNNKYTCPTCKTKLRTTHDLIKHIVDPQRTKCERHGNTKTIQANWKQATELNKPQEINILDIQAIHEPMRPTQTQDPPNAISRKRKYDSLASNQQTYRAKNTIAIHDTAIS